MGITVHFEGRLKDEVAYERAITTAIRFASVRDWPAESFRIELARLSRVKDEQDWDYEGPTRGISLRPHSSCEPIRLEFDRELYIQEYTKTQFAPPEVHRELVALLVALGPYFVELVVFDEGEYYETRDEEVLLQHRNRCFELLDEHLRDDKFLKGPVRLPSGRIADLIRNDA